MIQRAGIEDLYDPIDRMDLQIKSAPARAGNTCDSGANHCKGVAMNSLTYPYSPDEAFERNQLALSILSHRRDPESVDQAIAALKGASIDDLMELNEDLSDFAPRYTQYEMEIESQTSFSAGWDHGHGHARGASGRMPTNGS